jgi:ribosome-associated protein YbcJ (S4-like RNA binding protein)
MEVWNSTGAKKEKKQEKVRRCKIRKQKIVVYNDELKNVL